VIYKDAWIEQAEFSLEKIACDDAIILNLRSGRKFCCSDRCSIYTSLLLVLSWGWLILAFVGIC